jgi:hypothetical protein
MRTAVLVGCILAVGSLSGCVSPFQKAIEAAGKDDAIVLEGEGGAKVLVSPRLQARIMTTTVGSAKSVGWVCYPEIAEGETHAGFNNFGGQDRFWIGPEAGDFGIYFEPGAEFDRKVWKVPADFDKGAYRLVEKGPSKVLFERDMAVTNYKGVKFQVKVRREVGLIPSADAAKALGTPIPAGVAYAGSYSDNGMTNTGAEKWKRETGLLNIWILGQFEPGPGTVIIAPFKPGEGPPYRDALYFGKVSESRLKVQGNCILFLADARGEGKFGIPQRRTPGLAGSFDFQKNLLVVVRFDVPAEPALYGDSTWVKNQPEPYAGDLFQTYNSNVFGRPDRRYAFYELESVSPSVELEPNGTVRHRHETHCLQGDYATLRALAQKILGVDLDEVRKAML